MPRCDDIRYSARHVAARKSAEAATTFFARVIHARLMPRSTMIDDIFDMRVVAAAPRAYQQWRCRVLI